MRHATPRNANNKLTSRTTPKHFWQNLFAKKLPRTHLLLATAVAFVLIFSLTIFPSKPVEAKRSITPIELPIHQNSTRHAPPEPKEELTEEPKEKAAPPSEQQAAQDNLQWTTVTVKSGDNLSTLFQRASLGASEVHKFITSNTETRQLKRIMPGETLNFGLNKEGQLAQLKYIKSHLESWQFDLADNLYNAKHLVREPELLPTYIEAEITDSLFVSGDRAGMPHGLIMDLAGIFGWDVDFALDIRKGDYFTAMYDEKYLDGEKIGTGKILAAEFTNQGKTFRAVRYTDNRGHSNYFTPEGRSMRKAFLRTPVKFSRVSSSFNMRRLHPVTGKVRPHRGIDYAAPTGTPIYASGDGKVVRAGYTKANGNYAVIQHGTQYSTKYLHMHKRYAKKGQTVTQGQTIGTVGSTGLATGPHLHYEFLVNGVHRNPRTVKFPKSDPIANNQLAEFKSQTSSLIASLAANTTTSRTAQASNQHTDQSNEG